MHLLDHDNKIRCNMTFGHVTLLGVSIYTIWWCWHWHQCHMMPLVPALASHDANCVTNGTITLLRSRQLEWGAMSLFDHVSSMAPLHSLGQDSWNEVQHKFFGNVTPLVSAFVPYDATSVRIRVMWCHWHQCWHYMMPINGTTLFLRPRQLKWDATWPIWSFDTIGITWCWRQYHNYMQHDFFGHVMPLALLSASYYATDLNNGTIAFLRLR